MKTAAAISGASRGHDRGTATGGATRTGPGAGSAKGQLPANDKNEFTHSQHEAYPTAGGPVHTEKPGCGFDPIAAAPAAVGELGAVGPAEGAAGRPVARYLKPVVRGTVSPFHFTQAQLDAAQAHTRLIPARQLRQAPGFWNNPRYRASRRHSEEILADKRRLQTLSRLDAELAAPLPEPVVAFIQDLLMRAMTKRYHYAFTLAERVAADKIIKLYDAK